MARVRVSFLPYAAPAPGRRRRVVTRADVVGGALAVLDEVGLDRLTMRRVGRRLGVRAASLYRHVRNKNELLVLLADEISGEIPAIDANGPWQVEAAALARRYRRGLAAHRDAARLMAATAPFGPRRLRHIEMVLRLLRRGGFGPRDAARAAYHFNNFVTEFAADEARFASAEGPRGVRRRNTAAEARRRFSALPRDTYPTIVELAAHLADDDPDALFAFGLQTWLRGLAPRAQGRVRPRSGRGPRGRRTSQGSRRYPPGGSNHGSRVQRR